MTPLPPPESGPEAVRELLLTRELLQERLDELNGELERKNRLLARNLLEKERERNMQQQILDNMASAVLMAGLDGRITEANPAACSLLQLPDLPAVAHDSLPRALAEVLEEVIRENRVIEQDQFRLQEAEEERIFRLRCRLVGDDAGEAIGALLILDDLTSVHRMEEHMAQVRTLAALGEMAASVAHELRNPLGGIGGFAALLQNRLENGTKERHYVNKIIEGVDGLNKIATNLLAYTRKVEPTFRQADLRAVLEEVLSFLQVEMDTMEVPCELRGELGEEALLTRMDPELLRQTFLNLCKNAVQAMQSLEEGPRVLALDLAASAGRITIDVRDTGPGIPEHHRRKLFNPFFTTRAKGTGLGLAIVRKNVELHAGSVELLDSGKGAHFRITLPRVREAESRAPRGMEHRSEST